VIQQHGAEVEVICRLVIEAPSVEHGRWFGAYSDANGSLTADAAVLVLPNGEQGNVTLIDVKPSEMSGNFHGHQAPPRI
jgi:hypothetical protein